MKLVVLPLRNTSGTRTCHECLGIKENLEHLERSGLRFQRVEGPCKKGKETNKNKKKFSSSFNKDKHKTAFRTFDCETLGNMAIRIVLQSTPPSTNHFTIRSLCPNWLLSLFRLDQSIFVIPGPIEPIRVVIVVTTQIIDDTTNAPDNNDDDNEESTNRASVDSNRTVDTATGILRTESETNANQGERRGKSTSY